MEIAICDDNYIEAHKLHDYIKEYSQDTAVTMYNSADAFISAFRNGVRYELVFMDIQMNGTNGVQAAEILHNEYADEKPLVVFFTITDAYLNSTHKYAWWYIRKPVAKEELFDLLEHAQQELHQLCILIETNEGMHNVMVRDIICVESSYGEVVIHTTQGQYKTKTSLSIIMQMLPEWLFTQTHRSYYVNFDHVINYNKSEIKLTNSVIAYLSRDKRQGFSDSFLAYFRGKRNV